MGKGILVTPTVDGNLLAGPTSVDMDDKENNETTSEGFSKIIEEASENLKNISFSKTITSFCGLRAVGETNDFIINSPEDGFINVAGIDSPGLSASPAIAEYIIEILNKQGLELNENKSFNPIRKPSHYFREAILEEKNRMIKENPVYGKIICRCETVSEGEIIEAIHKNPGASDIDGIKRRTRSGMGRCQGGFCLPHVVEILARELDVPYERITKSGKGSKVVCGRTKGKK
jgi:glycerol-3-phosphate dehydrogenase